MFGYYDIPVEIEQEGISLFVQKEEENIVCTRDCLEEQVEKRLLATKGKVLLNPVEPLNKPKVLTQYLLIEFEKALVIEPRGTGRIFLTFPIDPRYGVICKYWKSDVYATIPSLNPLREGVMELAITNRNPHWVELTRVVFNAYGMKL